MGPGPDTQHRHQRHTSRDHTPTPSPSREGPPGGRKTTRSNEKQACAPTRNTALHAAGLRTPDDNIPPPPTDSNHPQPEVWCTVLERGHYYVVAATATSPGPQWLVQGTDTMLAPGTAPPGAVGDPTTPHRVLRGVLQTGDKPPARALAQITSGQAGYQLGLALLCLAQWIERRWPSTGTVSWILGHHHRPHTNRGRPRHPEGAPPRPQHYLTCGYHAIPRVVCRVALSPELAYPLPTTDQGVHHIHRSRSSPAWPCSAACRRGPPGYGGRKERGARAPISPWSRARR